MGKSVNRTKKANVKCLNCKYMKMIQVQGKDTMLCSINNTLVDAWDKCDKFRWREDKSYDDTPEVNLLR